MHFLTSASMQRAPFAAGRPSGDNGIDLLGSIPVRRCVRCPATCQAATAAVVEKSACSSWPACTFLSAAKGQVPIKATRILLMQTNQHWHSQPASQPASQACVDHNSNRGKSNLFIVFRESSWGESNYVLFLLRGWEARREGALRSKGAQE